MMDTTTLDRMRDEHCFLLDKSLPRVVRQLREMPAVEKVILFGSYAAGRRDLFTDLDLIVVMQSDQPFIDRSALLYLYLQPSVGMDILVYTPEEFERMSQGGFLRLALRTGQVLYEK
jgi:predicted nucleotidyltransferase